MTVGKCDGASPQSGSIAYMDYSGVEASFLRITAFSVGLHSIGRLDQELRRDPSLHHMPLTVSHPGASPEEVHESIIRKQIPVTFLMSPDMPGKDLQGLFSWVRFPPAPPASNPLRK